MPRMISEQEKRSKKIAVKTSKISLELQKLVHDKEKADKLAKIIMNEKVWNDILKNLNKLAKEMGVY